MNFEWSDLAFSSKKPINNLKAVFIAAPRALTAARFTQLVKKYLPQSNMVVGLAREDYIEGFEGQPQFKTLRIEAVQSVIDKVNASSSPHKIFTLMYFQREQKHLLEKFDFKKVVLVNGSWQFSFHTRADYYAIVNRGMPYEFVSPFTSEAEARQYSQTILPPEADFSGVHTKQRMLKIAQTVAACSFDYSYQTGVCLGRKQATDTYEFIAATFNKVVPYQAFAMHHGASRERHFSPPHDLNHYDAVHAEVELIIAAQKQALDLRGTTLFINLLPCPSCARMLTETDIAEFVYIADHSNGYALQMLESAGKKVTRVMG